MKKWITTLATAGALTLALAGTASADVLYEPPHQQMIVGSCIAIQAWYQSYSGGSPYISAYVTKNGRRVSRTVTVRTNSRSYSWKPVLCPQTMGSYKVHFKAMGIRWTDSVYFGMGD